jgi:hypothetical protein
LSLVTGMDARAKLGILRAVFHARHPEAADAFDKLVQKIERLGKVRNAIAHGRWSKGDRPGSVETTQFLSSGRLRVRSHGKPYPSASGDTKCSSREGRLVLEQITNLTPRWPR